MRRLELEGLPLDRPVRILEVGVGTGANLPRIEAALPPGLAGRAEVWGLDLSRGMLAGAQRRISRLGYGHVRLVQGDAHALPFRDQAFDRVFHVGGIGGFRDPARALAELARVARPGSPIVVVDEQLEPGLGPLRWTFFRALTFYDRAPHCPVEALPPGAWDILEEQVSRFYYSLRFRVG
jgi:ubiquinone/menaquinone biosynthesis C-methylase UbiE